MEAITNLLEELVVFFVVLTGSSQADDIKE